MTWEAYEIVFRLRTPLHIGWRKIGNVQQTRPYVTGRAFWGALTARLTRDTVSSPDSGAYQRIGNAVHQSLAYTCFYPATRSNNGYRIAWPWEQPARFRYRFMSSYGSTALSYPAQSAAEGTLHEVEFLSPHTLDTGDAVFLIGYVFAKNGCDLPWQAACQRLQVGGERGYGWGALALISCQHVDGIRLFAPLGFDGRNERPVLQIDAGQPLLSHTLADDLDASGDVEPLVGREWKQYPGQQVTSAGICFAPGSRVEHTFSVVVENSGLWKVAR